MENKDLLSLENYIEWLDYTVETLLMDLNKDLKDNVSYHLETYALGIDQTRTHVTSNIEQWKKKTNKLKTRINTLANEAHNMRKIPKSDEYQSVKDNYESELCYSEFLISIITKVIDNDPRAKDNEPKIIKREVNAMDDVVIQFSDKSKIVVQKDGSIRGNLSNGIKSTPWAPSADDLAERLKKEIKKGLGQISGGLR
ncbi:hypothetical protein GJ20_gp65 [Lactococcus phage P092]|uniref:Uncharacterized protein n=1 Tax=Lactococcus phage P092 TaxID=1476887 RepID=X4Y7W6_9CAUD|nr:hypothetical protein GJ20_gp65 [Lactococcus phage P092]AHV83106.1 hypothetical protein P092_0065 [Lactococcus phage P092]